MVVVIVVVAVVIVVEVVSSSRSSRSSSSSSSSSTGCRLQEKYSNACHEKSRCKNQPNATTAAQGQPTTASVRVCRRLLSEACPIHRSSRQDHGDLSKQDSCQPINALRLSFYLPRRRIQNRPTSATHPQQTSAIYPKRSSATRPTQTSATHPKQTSVTRPKQKLVVRSQPLLLRGEILKLRATIYVKPSSTRARRTDACRCSRSRQASRPLLNCVTINCGDGD